MGIKLDLLTVLVIVVIFGVLITMGLSSKDGQKMTYVSVDQLKSTTYQVAYKPK